jgi:protein-tyrosine phosphatase
VKDVFWIEGDANTALAIVLRPRGNDWLEDELIRTQQSGVQTLVSMLEDEEAESLGLSEEKKIAEQLRLGFLSFPIADRTTPTDVPFFREFIASAADRLRAGERLGIHCRGSIGRASIAAACMLIHLGWNREAALAAIEAARGCVIPDTEEQRAWILGYEAAS